MICRDTPHGWVHWWFGGWVVQWVNGWGQVITKYWINLDLIEIIQFCLKIYDLCRHPHPWVDWWAHVKSLKSNKSWPNQDNSIMDIFDNFLTFYLNHLSPLWGYFFASLHLAYYFSNILLTFTVQFPKIISASLCSPYCKILNFVHLPKLSICLLIYLLWVTFHQVVIN